MIWAFYVTLVFILTDLRSVLLLFCAHWFLLISAQETRPVHIPEPLMFDLVRGLGAEKGELEVNALADIPLNNGVSRAIEWAPEIEYALFNGLAVEFELPLENAHLEALKFALQYTFGLSDNQRFIHGVQLISESYLNQAITELSILYVPAYRFNEVWSVLGLFGLMYELGADAANTRTTPLLNASLFANLNPSAVLGLELNNTDPTLQKLDDNDMELLILPQFHYDFASGFSFQLGFGPRFAHGSTEYSGVLRVIQTF